MTLPISNGQSFLQDEGDASCNILVLLLVPTFPFPPFLLFSIPFPLHLRYHASFLRLLVGTSSPLFHPPFSRHPTHFSCLCLKIYTVGVQISFVTSESNAHCQHYWCSHDCCPRPNTSGLKARHHILKAIRKSCEPKGYHWAHVKYNSGKRVSA